MVKLRETEVILRVCIVFLLLLTACLIGLDSQTKEIAYIHKKVSFKYLIALEAELYIDVVVAAYNLAQLGLHWHSVEKKTSNTKWFSYLLDQTAAYVVFAGTSAAAQHSLLVVTGSKELQWMKWCYKFTRFCFQVGSAIILNYIGAGLMVLLSFISAFNLFRLYSPKRFFRLKSSS
ncbi:PREDICTED: CASP-like protein 2C1 [Camelina sativa]|uniref:CASP-like protein n=1 Tax=Camelina sativa TaxID=90675 RepID=A0ABM0UBS0_CAMSA|nr:PREDICTED: CASP-like protein 2C1 [Camelina sativa]